MNNRTLVKIYNQIGFFRFITISRSFRSPGSFYILKEKIKKHDWKSHLIVKDRLSYAELIKWKKHGIDILEIRFTWLIEEGIGDLKAHCETINLPYALFEEMNGETAERKILSMGVDVSKTLF